MARMSIDDKFLRDGRVKLLGQRFGWSRRETMGALLDVFAVAYDREDDVLPDAEIDAAADKQGFADAMVDVDLGERIDGEVRVKGAAERIEYLAKKREAGQKGGRKSGESRRKRREAKRSSASEAGQAHGNPPDSVPDSVPDSQRSLPRDPAVPGPAPSTREPHPTEPPDQRTQSPPAPTTEIPTAAMLMRELEVARSEAARELGVEVLPLVFGDRGERDCADRISLARSQGREALERVIAQSRHAIAMAKLETVRREKSIEWFTGAVFSPDNFRRLVAKTAQPTIRAGPRRAEDPKKYIATSKSDEPDIAHLTIDST